ncbi:Digalactosyldiacylglycerol synthase 1 [Arabidopsis thaliana]|uniref:Digalactosyldiacylglycerol synthase 1, chloroplastic n=4 Tax=Arabidopsis TaxID=3701 RepID=DGDG1_ARATH|nr:UDP-Glycosyltransferase superfamily protein [Arabidopsis thaliana]Q9S7D1.1 RecName: Full=Digalactosyldiacylglycerol synthase 1, chloroplastic; Flags: Precursor [Arabidopsis thaliana]KAG7624855.1 Glycosyl transferase family 1 [Arabidopsis thaliana x Arabidopsis arenosa]AAD42378.1 digalactosyldiacylglycerol synthase [Arabidopsis thaliana]AAD42379.1 digalactosyldiacylglycerol synthase [Arabidopsis thaliana]AAF02140.1 digalactosyldiacylglycerol synthase [Arabidopsis thaliana]AAL77656.1 AT3g116|eukprot:NP_187773.1 UDP-Glycosyltransferase superfamily protein [Arabidopsis thaliana]
MVKETLIPPSSTSMTTGTSSSSSLSMTLSSTNALSFLSKGWREVWDSADADLQLMRDRANSVKNLASTFDREIENFLNNSARSAFPVGSPSASSFSNEIGIMKKLQPKISEFRRVYSAPEISRKVMERWGPARAKLGMDLSAIKKAIVSEMELDERQGVLEMSRLRRRRNSDRVRFTEFFAEAERDGEAYFGDWEPIRSLKSRFKEFEKRSSLEILSGFKNSEFVEKLKTSFKSIYKETDEAKDVPPLDVPELLACLVRQSEPFLDQIGVRKDTCDRIVESLCKCKSQQLWRLPSAQASDLIENDNHGVDLDMRIASVLQSTGHHYDGGFWTDFVKPETPENKRHVAIVTTASLPWMTGTAVNPLFRAAYLAKAAKQSVTLVVPWLCESDQELVYPNNLTFSSPEEQESYIRKWLEERIGFKADFKISFYPGKFSKERRSIFPAGDTSQFISSKDADIAILEEPEHLNWYYHGKRWTDKFNHVVGIVHTNYLEYIKREKNGALQAFFVNHVNNWVTRAYCDKVLRLSAATQDLPKSVVCNVHGVNPKFLMIGEKIAEERSRGEQAFSKGAYFLGKMVWAKGYRELIDLMAKHKSELGSFNLDVYGNGEDAVEVQRAAKKHDLNLNFLKGRDHADDALHKYKVFINPSISDVLCTATAEALAMGKFVVCADHPSNEFFRSFPNCLTYKTSEDFVSKVQEAMTKEPLPLTPEQMYNLSWEAATQRFMEYSDLDKILNNGEGGRKMRKSRSVPSFNEVVDGGLAFSHYVLTGNDFLRLCTGATPRTKDYDNQHCKDLNLVPPHVHKPIFGW